MASAFTQLDDGILDGARAALHAPISHAEAMCRIAPASSGSCATLVLHDPSSSTVHVANAGDSRAVLVRWRPSGTKTEDGAAADIDGAETARSNNGGKETGWVPIPLSEDHTGLDEGERDRIGREHPGEEGLVSPKGRLLGSAVTRSFGDNRWKWSSDYLKDWEHRFFGRASSPRVKTPPYITAAPTVQSQRVQGGDFIVIASDGFWNHISNEDAAHCLGMWADAQDNKLRGDDGDGGDTAEVAESECMSSGDAADSWGRYPYNWIVNRADFVIEDDNAATHLLRNVFGGGNRDLFCSVLSTKPPDAKEARDDVTVVVVHF